MLLDGARPIGGPHSRASSTGRAPAGAVREERRQVVEVDRLRGGVPRRMPASDGREARRVGTEDLGEARGRLERCVGGVGLRVDEGADDREPQRPLDQRDAGLVGRADRRGEVRRA